MSFVNNTIDMDSNDKYLVAKIYHKISQCPNCFSLRVEMTQHKGVMFILQCRNDCDLCRFVFDDEIRYGIDILRVKRQQNLVWREKQILSLNQRFFY